MKRNFLYLLVLGALVWLSACSGNENDPKTVTRQFYEAMKTFNTEEAAKYATRESKGMLDLMKMGMSFAALNQDSIKAEMAKQKIEFSEPAINGDEATVSVTVDGKDKTDFKLKKEEGQWKVAFDKNTLMKTGIEKARQEGADPAELEEAKRAMEMLKNSDSLKSVLEKAGGALQDAGKQLDSLAGKE